MPFSSLTRQRLAAVCLLGGVLFNYPLLSLFNQPGALLEVPLLYLYLFGAWATLIGLMAYCARQQRMEENIEFFFPPVTLYARSAKLQCIPCRESFAWISRMVGSVHVHVNEEDH